MSRTDVARYILTEPSPFAPEHYRDPYGRDEIRELVHAVAELERAGTSVLIADIFMEFCRRYYDCLAARRHSERRFGVLRLRLAEVAVWDVERDPKVRFPPIPPNPSPDDPMV